MPLPSELKVVSFLAYSPRGKSQTSRDSKQITLAVKNDTFAKTAAGVQRIIPYSAKRVAGEMAKYPVLAACFSGDVILVPAPRSGLLVGGGLWPALKLCEAFEQHGVGSRTLQLLRRVTAVRKSATASAGERPTPEQHFESIAVDASNPLVSEKCRFVIVDDVVTRGATFLGCFARLREAYPDAPISCFALVRTMSNVEVVSILAPIESTISYQSGYVHREP